MTIEEMVLATIGIIGVVGVIGTLYFTFQIIRNEVIFNIRRNWINTRDSRWNKYAYDDMYEPNINNWFGLRYPKDKHFK